MPPDLIQLEGSDERRRTELRTVLTVIDDLSSPPHHAADVYLHLPSHQLVRPRG